MKFKYLVCSAAMLLALAGCNQPASGGDPVVETVSVTGVALNKTTVALTVNQTETLTATITPANATNKNVTWSASGDGVVSVVDGLVRALKPGTSTVTATTVDGGYTANCEVTVSAATVAVTGVTLNKASLSLTVGDSETLTATVAPSDATNKNVTWSVTGDAVTVNNGTVTAAKAGNATVTVTTVDGGFTANCAVTVKEAKPADAVDLAYSTSGDIATHGDDYCYFNDPEWWSGASAAVNEAYYSPTAGLVFDYTYNPASNPGINNWSVQLMRKNSSLTVGTMYDLTFKLNSSKAGTIIVNDTNTAIVKGDNNIKVTYRQGEGASFNIQFSFNLIGDARVVITDILWEAALAAPEGVVVSENAGVYTIAFAAVTGVDSYKAYYVDANGQDVANETVTNGGQLTKVSTLADGTYKVFVTSVKGTKESARSTSFGRITKGSQPAVVPAGGPKTNIGPGEEHNQQTGALTLPDDKFVYWADQWYCGSGVTVSEGDAYTEEGTVTAKYTAEANSNCTYGFQLFYKNTNLTAGKTYTLSYTLTSEVALTVTANGAQVVLEAGVAANVSVDYAEVANNASFALVTPVVGAFTNTLVISNLSWVEK